MTVRELLEPIERGNDDARRLLHGRGGCYRGLEHVALDWFPPVLVATLYGAPAGGWLDELAAASSEHGEVEGLVVQRRDLPGAPKSVAWGQIPQQPLAREAGLSFYLQLLANRNTGFFLDMRPGREWLRAHASGRRVLNLFAYTCSLSVAALAGGAEEVVNVDMARGALRTGRANHQLNLAPGRCRRARLLCHDLFKSWGKLRRLGPFDIVVVDPPSCQRGSFVAAHDYAKVVRRLPELLGEGGLALGCLNSPFHGAGFLEEVFGECGYEMLQALPAAPGFDQDREPDRGLKAVVFGARRSQPTAPRALADGAGPAPDADST